MSEILNYEANVSAVEGQIDVFDNSAREISDENWDIELFSLVARNENVVVRCPWMNDIEISLSAAMNAYPEPMTRENAPLYLSAVLQLLANRVTEPEEAAEEDRPEEEEPAQTEVQKVQEDSKAKDAERQSQKETDRAERQEQFASGEEKTSGSEVNNEIAAKAEVVANQSQSEQFTQGAGKAEPANSSSNSRADTTSGKSPRAPEALAVTNSTSGSSAPESVTNESKQEIRLMVLPVEDKSNGTQPAIKTAVEAKPAPDKPELAAGQETEAPALSVALEAVIEPELTELSPLDFESIAISDNTTQLNVKKIKVAEYEPALVNLESEVDTNSLANFDEEEILIAHYEEVDLEIDELHMFSIEPNLSGQMGITNPEQPVEINLTIEEIEDSLIQLAERIEASEPETTEKVNEILDKIINVPAKPEAHNGENIITEVEAQEELEELFAELLDDMGIDYTPELIESLASLTLKWHLTDEIEKLKDEEEANSAPQASGTHKIIKKLLAGLSTIKKAIAHACAIGKSALQLYATNSAT